MKVLGQTKDGVIDSLLRAYVSRPGNTDQMCPDFDPDQANAYIEQNLTGASRLRYETHLSECAACRKTIVALVRLAEADRAASAFPAREPSRSNWLISAKRIFGAMSQPQWAMAAVAAIVLAISLPLLLTRNQHREESSAMLVGGNAQNAPAPAADAPNPTSAESAPARAAAAAKQREKSDEKPELLAKGASADANEANARAGVGGVVGSRKTEDRAAGEPVDEIQRKSEGALAQVPTQGGAAPNSQVAKNDSDQNRQQQPEKEKDSAPPASDSKALRPDEESAGKDKVGRTEEVAQPPAPASSSEVARSRGSARKAPAKLSLRDSGTAESVRLSEWKLNGKKFLFRDGAWTDKDFNPDKDLPVVTIIRDSNVYKEVLSKRPGLKPFLTSFSPADRAIIVYKGTVYKLIPQ